MVNSEQTPEKNPSEQVGSTDSLMKRFRTLFLTGLIVLGPIVLTIWIVVHLFLFADNFLGRPIRYVLGNILDIQFFHDQTIYGIGLISLLILILLAGWFARNYLGGKIVNLINRWIKHIPLINKVYSAFLQLSEALLGGQREVFKYAVLIEYPKDDVYSIGFVTQDTRGPAQNAISEDVISVFIPTTPNPTSGYLLFVPKRDVTYVDLSVEEALKLVISGGTIVPKKGGGSPEAARRLGINLGPVTPGETTSP
ncbi:MAG: DUF502 domain-containing protein [bacterium]